MKELAPEAVVGATEDYGLINFSAKLSTKLMIFDARESSPSLTPHLFAVSKPATMLSITSAE